MTIFEFFDLCCGLSAIMLIRVALPVIGTLLICYGIRKLVERKEDDD